jgi:hypothetical protein
MSGLTAEWTGRNLAEIQAIAPGARRVPGPHGASVVVATAAGEPGLVPGGLVYLEAGAVRAYSRLVPDCGLYDLLAGGA